MKAQKIPIIKTTPTAIIPKAADNGSAGLDLYADRAYDAWIRPGETKKVPTGICIHIPRNHFGGLYPRSSLFKNGLMLANQVGIIDSSYRGEIQMMLTNISSEPIHISAKDGLDMALCQLIIQPYMYSKLVEVAVLSETTRGSGGFGSTDKKGE